MNAADLLSAAEQAALGHLSSQERRAELIRVADAMRGVAGAQEDPFLARGLNASAGALELRTGRAALRIV